MTDLDERIDSLEMVGLILLLFLRQTILVDDKEDQRAEYLGEQNRLGVVYDALVLQHVKIVDFFLSLMIQIIFGNASDNTPANPTFSLIYRYNISFLIKAFVINVANIIFSKLDVQLNTFDFYFFVLVRITFYELILFLGLFQINFDSFTNFINHSKHVSWLKLHRLVNTHSLKSALDHENE